MTQPFTNLHRKSLMLHACGVVVLSALTLVCWFAIFIPASNRRNEAAEVSRRTATLQSEAKRQTRLHQRLTSELAKSRELLLGAEVELLPPSKLNERLAAIADLAGRCKIRIDNINPTSVQNGQLLQIRLLNLTGHGSYPTAYQFMHEVRSALPDMSVRSFTLSAEPDNGHGGAAFDMTLTWCADAKGEQTTSAR